MGILMFITLVSIFIILILGLPVAWSMALLYLFPLVTLLFVILKLYFN
jgi:hypothetical protein